MRSGVSFPTYADQATYALVTGAAVAGFPVQSLSDLNHIRTVFQQTAAGVLAFTFVLPALRAVQMLALLHHTAAAAETIRIRLFSDNNPDPVGNAAHLIHDSTAISILPGGASPYGYGNFAQNFPYRLPAALNVMSGRIDLSAGATPWILGGLEISGFWEWQDVAVPREFGVESNDILVQGAFDVDYVMGVWQRRTVKGQRAVIDQSEARTTAMDFFAEKGLEKPFVYAWDMDDVTTYPRETILVRNIDMTPPTMNDFPTATFDFNFVEHLA